MVNFNEDSFLILKAIYKVAQGREKLRKHLYERRSFNMTKNQIDYWRSQEEKRSNQEKERLNRKVQRWNEHVQFHTLRETQRANQAREQEQRRTNLANEQLKSQSNLITQNHYQNMEAETNRANLANEQLRAVSNDLQKQSILLGYHQADVSRQNTLSNVGLGYSQLNEATRSNLAREAETTRHAQATERNEAMNTGVKQGYLGLENSKWYDSIVTAQRQANLQKTKVETSDVVHNAADRRVKTITGALGSLGNLLTNVARGGRSIINLGG